jgi:hypothetical protein
MSNIKFYIPFGGFYNSIYDSIIDDILENEIEEGYLTEKQVDKINYTNLHLKLSEHIFDEILEIFNDEFDLFTSNDYITFDGISSPKYYNYTTDKIKAITNPKIYLTLLNRFGNDNDFVNYVNEASKSRDGFASFYEGINEVKKDSSIFLEYLFQWFILEAYRNEVIEATTENIHEVIYNNL